MSFKILGTGHFVPEHVVTNEDISKLVETSDEWIMKRIGVKERHVCTTETAVDLGVQAARRAMESAGTSAEELDLIIGTTISGDTISPGLGCMVQKALGASCPAMDMATACTGFVFALDVAAGYFARKTVKKVLIVSAERMSGVVDWTDRGTCCIFGDGAGAAVLGEGEGYLGSVFDTRGGDDVISIPIKSEKSPFYENSIKEPVVYMNGQETYKFAVTTLASNIQRLLEQTEISGSDVSMVIPHQANFRIINEARRRITQIDSEKFCINIDRYGNTSSASVPILLDEANAAGKLKRGDNIILAAFGGGLISCASMIRW